MWKYSRCNKVAKIIISIVAALVVIINVGNSGKTTDTNPVNSTIIYWYINKNGSYANFTFTNDSIAWKNNLI